MNVTVPVNIVTKDQVYRISAKGWSSMNSPNPMTTQANISSLPRLSHRGQRRSSGSGVFEVTGVGVGVDIRISLICEPRRK